jgi:hypothetical protein
VFLFSTEAKLASGNMQQKDAVRTVELHSGDVLVFGSPACCSDLTGGGGPARMMYHGVGQIVPHTAPPVLKMSCTAAMSHSRLQFQVG